tara:strand:+ start:3623 stop:3802 length:180 start_codon:yes stop_codon:yes gene_type:complete
MIIMARKSKNKIIGSKRVGGKSIILMKQPRGETYISNGRYSSRPFKGFRFLDIIGYKNK